MVDEEVVGAEVSGSHGQLLPSPARRVQIPDGLRGLPATFWLLWTGTLVNRLGTFVEPFLVLYLTHQRGFSVPAAGAVLTVYGAGALVSQPLGGVLADRLGRVPVLCAGLVSNAAANVLLGLARGPGLIVAAAVLAGLTVDLYRPASQALVADVVAAGLRGRAFNVLFWAANLGFAVATSLAGFLAAHGYWLLFAGDAVTSGLAALLLAVKVRQPRRGAAGAGPGPSGGLRTVLGDRLLLAATGLTLLFASVYAQVFATLPLAVRAAGIPAAGYGLILAANGVLIVLIQPFAIGKLARYRRTRVLAVSQLVVGFGFALTALAHSLAFFLATLVVWTLGEIGNAGLMNAVVAGLAPAHLRGRYMGVYGLAWGGAGALGPAVGTAVYSALGPDWLWAGCGLAGVGLAAGQVALGRALDRHAGAAPPGSVTPQPAPDC